MVIEKLKQILKPLNKFPLEKNSTIPIFYEGTKKGFKLVKILDFDDKLVKFKPADSRVVIHNRKYVKTITDIKKFKVLWLLVFKMLKEGAISFKKLEELK